MRLGKSTKGRADLMGVIEAFLVVIIIAGIAIVVGHLFA